MEAMAKVNKKDLIDSVAVSIFEKEDIVDCAHTIASSEYKIRQLEKLNSQGSELSESALNSIKLEKDKIKRATSLISKRIINEFCDTVEKNVIDGNTVSIRRLCTFELKELSEREVCSDFNSKERKKVKRRTSPRCYVSKHLKEQFKQEHGVHVSFYNDEN